MEGFERDRHDLAMCGTRRIWEKEVPGGAAGYGTTIYSGESRLGEISSVGVMT